MCQVSERSISSWAPVGRDVTVGRDDRSTDKHDQENIRGMFLVKSREIVMKFNPQLPW